MIHLVCFNRPELFQVQWGKAVDLFCIEVWSYGHVLLAFILCTVFFLLFMGIPSFAEYLKLNSEEHCLAFPLVGDWLWWNGFSLSIIEEIVYSSKWTWSNKIFVVTVSGDGVYENPWGEYCWAAVWPWAWQSNNTGLGLNTISHVQLSPLGKLPEGKNNCKKKLEPHKRNFKFLVRVNMHQICIKMVWVVPWHESRQNGGFIF